MIGLNCKFQNIPTVFDTFGTDKVLTILSYLPREYGLASPRAPNEVIYDQVGAFDDFYGS